MKYTENPKIDYDERFDIMNCFIGDTSNTYDDEDIDNIVVMKDFDTDEIKGYTIMNFKRMSESGSELLNTLISVIGQNIYEAMKEKCN